ncbi:PilZ domain-containing protein [Methylobacterium sp. J-088]|uniref:PilZ domain-containing protein n=1 Tax=unclassified Methylobacterium TaxID=2615210 RepID=UPI001FB99341|nr:MULTISPECIES: PilZ domain-containing protein [unclassified Methylobacterium]MCJ2065687.1 PilZ domain-containing protein [Methylobacterium sp. J-088]
MSEHRRETRQRVFLKGRIVFNNGSSSLDCLVRDMSSSGARLVMSETTTLPEVFDLYIPQKDRTYRATLRWRREDGIGVTFEDAARAPAAAVPDPVATDASVTLLLRRVSELETENAALRRLLASMAQGDSASAA